MSILGSSSGNFIKCNFISFYSYQFWEIKIWDFKEKLRKWVFLTIYVIFSHLYFQTIKTQIRVWKEYYIKKQKKSVLFLLSSQMECYKQFLHNLDDDKNLQVIKRKNKEEWHTQRSNHSIFLLGILGISLSLKNSVAITSISIIDRSSKYSHWRLYCICVRSKDQRGLKHELFAQTHL